LFRFGPHIVTGNFRGASLDNSNIFVHIYLLPLQFLP
jgi:hypothetical protein